MQAYKRTFQWLFNFERGSVRKDDSDKIRGEIQIGDIYHLIYIRSYSTFPFSTTHSTMLDIHHHQHHHHDPWPLVSNDKHADHPDIFQPYSLAVIELVEVPPPPRHISSPSSYYFSSEDDDDDSEDDAESAESYCSSDQDMPSTPLVPRNDSFQRCMKRILVWREKSLSSSDYRGMLSLFT